MAKGTWLSTNDTVQTFKQLLSNKKVLFLTAFALLRIIFEQLLRLWAYLLGAPAGQLTEIVLENEIALQLSSLLGALCLLHSEQLLRRRFYLSELISAAWWSQLSRRAKLYLSFGTFFDAFFKGFVVASLLVAVQLFSASAKLEAAPFGWSVLTELWSYAYSEVFLLLVWILLLETSRKFLWSQLGLRGTQKSLSSAIWIILWEASLFFLLIGSSPFLADKAFAALLCFILAAANLLWLELGQADPSPKARFQSQYVRVAAFMGFLLTHFHIFGQPRGTSRFVSLYHISPVQVEGAPLLQGNVHQDQIWLLLFTLFLVNALLQRAFKRMTQTA